MIIGSEIIFVMELTSTNSYAINLVNRKNPPEGTLIYTAFQTAGRGQPGNKWESEDGKNLLFSFILYPYMIRPENQFIISMTISLGITDFLGRHLGSCAIKWPNDIYVGSDKIAGILIESSIMDGKIEYLVAGAGINVNQEEFRSGAPNPVSMKMITGINYEIRSCLEELAGDLDERYKKLREGNVNLIRDEYISKLYRYQQWANFRDEEGVFTGRIISVTDEGKLIIEKEDGAKAEYFFKEVEFIH